MPRSAPRIPWLLVEALGSLDGPDRSIADVWRAACLLADEHGFTRPSYEQIRRLLHRQRRLRAMPSAVTAIAEGWLRARSPESAVHEAMRRSLDRRLAQAVIGEERTWRPDGERDAEASRAGSRSRP